MARQAARAQVVLPEMANDAQIVIRVPQTMADRIKQYAEQLAKNAGVPVSTAAATRKLLELGLEQVQSSDSESARPRRR